MPQDKISERALREREQYNQGSVERESYHNVLSHTGFFSNQRRMKIVTDIFKKYVENKTGIEIGSKVWLRWIERTNIRPEKLTCINISQRELDKSIDLSSTTNIKPEFRLMDAHHLDFDDESCDFVFGAAILHHLDYTQALNEIRRVLKPGGIMVFMEPLDINPIGKMVRLLTPKSRTVDEKPLGLKEIRALRERFNCQFYFDEFFSVPFGVLSKILFKKSDNIMMRFVFYSDLFVEKSFLPARYLYRKVTIIGVRQR